MFNKKKCKKCNEKINKDYNFCPYCGTSITGNSREDFGMLGKNDSINEFEDFSRSMFGGISGNIFNKMIGNAMKMLEEEMQKEMKRSDFKPKTNFQMFINGKKVDFGNNIPVHQKKQKAVKDIPKIDLPQNNLENFSTLPRETPKTEMRRFNDKIVYELKIPGVKTLKDISVIKLEKSIEIRAVSKKKSYQKILPLDLPIINYNLEKDKLIIEFGILG
ncbi:MAG: zinc-ribbon domain-containing protein [Nanoarchaeota archaeon]|nr:zinc-ribbon domain-containing protein [Nanoarchaeota archaeon]